MKRLQFKKLDAFAQGLATGNPAGAVYLEPGMGLSADQMLRVARELAGFVSEVVYIQEVTGGDVDLRLTYYSAEREVAFCGHATIAAAYDLLSSRSDLKGTEGIWIQTQMGRLAVTNRLPEEDAVYIAAPAPTRTAPTVNVAELATSLGTAVASIDERWPIALVNAGLSTLIVPIAGLDPCLDAAPKMAACNAACVAHGADIIALFTTEVADSAHAFRTRVFAPTFGYLEDPATGTASAALGHYWRDEGLWDDRPIVLEQGISREHPNQVRLLAEGGASDTTVLFGGSAVSRIEGHYLLWE